MDVRAAARLALPHRRRRQPFDAPQLDEEKLDRALAGAGEDPGDDPGPGDDGPGGGEPEASHETTQGQGAPEPRAEAAPDPGPHGQPQDPAAEESAPPRPGPAPARPAASPGPVFRVKRLDVPGTGTGAAGRRSRARTDSGHVTGAQRPRDRAARVHVPATFAAAAPYQVARGRSPGGGLLLRPGDLREAQHEGRESNLVLFVGGRQRFDGGPGQDGRGQGRGAVPAARRLPAPGQGRHGHVPGRRGRARAAAHVLGRGGRRPAGRAADRRAHPARGRAAPGRGFAARRAHPRPAPPPAAGPGHRRPRYQRPGPGGQRAPGGGPAGRGGSAQRGRRLRVRSGPARPGRRAGPVPRRPGIAPANTWPSGPLADSVRVLQEVA